VISALGKLRQEDQEFEVRLSYIVILYLKSPKQAGHQWLTPAILVTWEAKIWRILV
jgi:hypothetical protein